MTCQWAGGQHGDERIHELEADHYPEQKPQIRQPSHEVYRLVTWAGLERPNAVAEFEADSYGAKLAAITDAQREGRLDASLAPADLLALAIGLAGSWFSASEAVRRFDSKDPWSRKRLAQFRDAAVEAAGRIVGP